MPLTEITRENQDVLVDHKETIRHMYSVDVPRDLSPGEWGINTILKRTDETHVMQLWSSRCRHPGPIYTATGAGRGYKND